MQRLFLFTEERPRDLRGLLHSDLPSLSYHKELRCMLLQSVAKRESFKSKSDFLEASRESAPIYAIYIPLYVRPLDHL